MAFDTELTCISVDAAGDLSAADYHPVKLDASGKAVACSAVADIAVGIVQNKPAVGQAATVAVAGVSKARAVGTIGAGALVAPAASGLGVQAAVSTNRVMGIALVGGVAGDIIPVLLSPGGQVL
ncbi:MAG: hypothetical protein KA761_00155 [Gemmatimonadaceae bacterium]|nr:hypothetical protein [Gemmatimonadaceae bacterium]